MATRSFIADSKTAAGVEPADHAPPGAGGILRYRLNVIAATTEDVVQSAGGWLCDRARAGWDVNVMVADGGDPRPLAILGATVLDLNQGFVSVVRGSARVGALAVSADFLGSDAGVRDEVLRLLKRGLTEVTVWGERWPVELGKQTDSVQHRVSSAARVFKSHALAAAELAGHSTNGTETLFRIGSGSFRPLYSV
jgi:hypothetical protein